MKRGGFIVIEGIEGAGKSTVLEAISAQLAGAGLDCLMTREPGGTELGEGIRELLLDPRYKGMHPHAELLLMFAARAQHVSEVIKPALERGQWVVSDRFTDASYAYQGAGRGLGAAPVATLETLVQDDLRPDRVLILDVPPQVGLERARSVSSPDRFEQEREAFFDRVRQAYLQRAEDDPAHYSVIDASRTRSEVREAVAAIIDDLLRSEPADGERSTDQARHNVTRERS